MLQLACFYSIARSNSSWGRATQILILVSPGVTKLQLDPYSALRSSPHGPAVFVSSCTHIIKHTALHFLAENPADGAHWTTRGQRWTTLPGILIADDCGRAQLVFTLFTLRASVRALLVAPSHRSLFPAPLGRGADPHNAPSVPLTACLSSLPLCLALGVPRR